MSKESEVVQLRRILSDPKLRNAARVYWLARRRYRSAVLSPDLSKKEAMRHRAAMTAAIAKLMAAGAGWGAIELLGPTWDATVNSPPSSSHHSSV